MSKYDPSQVTHVVTNKSKALFLKKAGLQNIRAVSENLPILRWEWVLSGERKGGLGRWHDFPTYADHVVFEAELSESEKARFLAEKEERKAGKAKGKQKAAEAKAVDSDESDNDDAEASRIS